MAAKAVLILASVVQASRTIRVGGVTIARNWASGAPFYTVPDNMKLTVKTISPTTVNFISDSNGVPTVTFSSSSQGIGNATYVFPAGTILSGASSTVDTVLTGFLDSDV